MTALILAHVSKTFPHAKGIDARSPLFSSAALDSMEMTYLEVWLERTFAVSLNYGDVHINTTDTVEDIARMIARKLRQ